MADLDQRQIVELFHVAFLDVLSLKLEQTRYVLKGGANLRYFFGSPRYSEDIDLDAWGSRPGSSRRRSTTFLTLRSSRSFFGPVA